MDKQQFVQALEKRWSSDPRWQGITRPYSAEDVYRLRGTIEIEHTLAREMSRRLWRLMHEEPYVHVLSAVTGNQAVQQVQAGLKAIYCSGWQVAADANEAQSMYPDQSLYPANSVPQVVRRINNALLRADQVHHLNGDDSREWLVPVVADAEAGFGGVLNSFEIMKGMVAAGAAGVHFEDQLASVKKCGHLGGKVLVPTREFVSKLVAARMAADLSGVDTLVIARTDADSATLLTSDVDPVDQAFLTGDRTHEGFYAVRPGIEAAIARGLAYAPYADALWMETARPDLGQARAFARAIHATFPGKLLAYNCSPSFNWRMHLSEQECADFQREIGALGYKFQFVTLSGFHQLNYGMFRLAQAYREHGMGAYAAFQVQEFEAEAEGYEAVRHQQFVGTGYFDAVTEIVTGGTSSTKAMKGSTETDQFQATAR